MKKLDEKSYSNFNSENPEVIRVSGHQVAYEFNNHIVKVVQIHTQHNYGGGYHGFLQTQKVGLDANLASIEFLDGEPFTSMTQSIDANILRGTKDDLSGMKHLTNTLLEKFGKEFKPIFDKDEKLKEYIPTHFTALIPYLK